MVEKKLDILVNAYLDEDIEKAMYVQKKEELLKTKKDLQEKKVNFGQKGNNWIEPLRKWIISANQAQKLGFSKDFHEMKIFARKNGTNHLMLDQKIKFQFKEPFDLIPKHKEICERSRAKCAASEQTIQKEKLESCTWSE